jgi:hypothetical protein
MFAHRQRRREGAQAMTILLEAPVPDTGRLSVHIHADMQINVSAAEAQRRVTQYVHRKISSQMHGELPTLILGERACWRTPIQLTFPALGNAGVVGTIDVDVETGEAQTTAAVIEEIERNAEDLARRVTSPAARRS